MIIYNSFQDCIDHEIKRLSLVEDAPYLTNGQKSYTTHEIAKILSGVNLTEKEEQVQKYLFESIRKLQQDLINRRKEPLYKEQ